MGETSEDDSGRVCRLLRVARYGLAITGLWVAGRRRDFALAAELDWHVSEDDAIRRVRQYFNGRTWRHLPARALLTAIRVSGLDYVTPLLQRELIRAEDAAEAELERPGARFVRRGRNGMHETG